MRARTVRCRVPQLCHPHRYFGRWPGTRRERFPLPIKGLAYGRRGPKPEPLFIPVTPSSPGMHSGHIHAGRPCA